MHKIIELFLAFIPKSVNEADVWKNSIIERGLIDK